MNIKISPNYDVTFLSTPLTPEKFISLYEDRIHYWILEPAKILSKYEHGGFSVCYLLASYFESFQIFFTGKNSKYHSKDYFARGFHSVFKDYLENNFNKGQINEICNLMYENFRCGLYHTGFTLSKITLVDLENPINAVMQLDDENKNYVLNSIEIDPTRMIYAIENHHQKYLADLQNPKKIGIRNNFLEAFKYLFSE